MAYVAPNSIIELFGDLNLVEGSEDTRYFASESAKNNWFNSQTKLARLTAQSYTRRDRGKIRVSTNATTTMATLYNAQYMRYQNTSFENKWFYAFIRSVEYINNAVAEITFTDDIIMTWMGNFTLGRCMVEREHTSSDNLYEHIIEEKLPTGDYVIRYMETVEINSDPQLVLSVARESATVGSAGHYEGNIVSGAEYRKYNISDSGKSDLQDDIDDIINDTGGQPEKALISANIVFGKMCPVSTNVTLKGLTPVNFQGSWTSSSHPLGEHLITGGKKYTPVNKKLYNYPYCVMDVYNQEGSEKEFRYEFFSDHKPHFYWFGIAADVPEACIIPTQYKGSSQGYVEDEMLVMRQFPQASIAVDQYKAYVAQMTSGGGYTRVAGRVASQTIREGASLIGNALAGNVLGAVGGAVNFGTSMLDTALNLLADKQHFESIPDSVTGTANSCLMMGINNKFFKIFHKSITAEYAETIDNFFTMYGYRVNKVKVPVMSNNRPYFTYLKTMGCNVHGSMPSSDARAIEEMFDRGIRFWTSSATTIGDYSLNNAPS